MKQFKVTTWTPKDKKPTSSTPMESYIVLIFCDGYHTGKKSWFRGLYLVGLEEWRIEGQNNSIEVDRWMEMPS